MQDYLEYIQSVFDIIKELKEYNPDLTEQFYREYEANLGSAVSYPEIVDDFFDFVESLRFERYEDCAKVKEKIIKTY